jgi:predicted ATPase/class 3 adenylate cyclase
MGSAGLPSGTLTFLFADVEGSTRLVVELGEAAWAEELRGQRLVIEERCSARGGKVVDQEGDGTFVVFLTASDALQAAGEIQCVLAQGRVRVRIGVHTGTPLVTDEGYVGLDVHRAARIAAAAHGGQVVFSATTRELVDEKLLGGAVCDLGEHRLKDLTAPERLFQLGDEAFPPLRSLPTTNIPVPATPFLGRRRELGELIDLLQSGERRLVTLTGPGGTGKTRLALQAAAEVSDAYPDGVWWTSLTAIGDAGAVLPAVAQLLGVVDKQSESLLDRLAGHVAGRRLLIVLDNAEHLLPLIADDVAAVVARCPGVDLLVTSRERMQLGAEVVFPVPPLSRPDGERLFLDRAQTAGVPLRWDETVAELCARLDELPLALELAAARTVVFTPAQLLERLGRRLDLLKGSRDAEPRQLTLRATIDWSYDLLTSEEQRLFAALAVFTNGCTYEAAEAIAGAEPDSLQSLLEKSLVRRRESNTEVRYWMLATIADYAREKLAVLPDRDDIHLRHAEWYRDRAVATVGIPGPRTPRAAPTIPISRFREDYANLRTGLGWAWEAGRDELAIEIGIACCRFWLGIGAYRDATAWLEAALPKLDTISPLTQLQALQVAGLIAYFVSADGDHADELWARAAVIAAKLGLDEDVAWIDHRRASVAWDRGDIEGAIATMERQIVFHQQGGNQLALADALHHLGEARRDLGKYDEAEQDLLAADSIYRELGDGIGVANNSHSLADLALDRGQYDDAIRLYYTTLSHASTETGRHEAYCLAGIASALAATGRDTAAATLWGAVCNAERTLGFRMITTERRRYESYLRRLEQGHSWAHGQTLSLQEAVDSLPAVLAIGTRSSTTIPE